MNYDPKKWHGNERRTCPNNGACLDHAGIIERVYSAQKSITDLERRNFVPWGNFKWTIGLIVSTLISLFGISIYLSIDVSNKINDLRSKQETIILKVSLIQEDIDQLQKQKH